LDYHALIYRQPQGLPQITLTDEAKKVLFIKVIKEDGSVEYIRNSATSFTMPAGAVTVSVIAPDNWFEEGRYDTDVYAATSSTLIVSDAADLAAVGKLSACNGMDFLCSFKCQVVDSDICETAYLCDKCT